MVISTLLLSAVVVSLVGLGAAAADHRRPGRAARPTRRSPRPPGPPPRRSAGCRRPTATTSTPAPSSPSWSPRWSRAASVQGYEIVLTRPDRRLQRPASPAGAGTSSTPGVLSRQHPARRCAGRSSTARSDQTSYTYATIRYAARTGRARGARRGDRLAGHAAGRRRHLHALLPVPDDRAGEHPLAGPPRPGHRRRPAAAPGRRRDLAGHPAGRHPGPAGPPGRRAAGVRPARGAHARARRRRHRPARHVVQPDGRQPAEADPPARGALPGAAPVRLRRLPRAAHPAHHGPDGRRRAARRPRAGSTRPPPAPPSCSRTSSTASSCCSPTCWRSAASTPAPRCSTSRTSTSSTSRTGSWSPPGPSPSGAASGSSYAPGDAAVRRRGRRPPGRADRPQPGHQRHRLRRQRGRGRARRRQRRGHRARGARPRGRAASRARRRWCSTGSGGPTRPGPAPPAAPASGCRSRWRTPTCTAAGCRPGASRAGGAQFRLTLPRRAGDRIGASPLPLVPRRRRACRGPGYGRVRPRRRTGGHVVSRLARWCWWRCWSRCSPLAPRLRRPAARAGRCGSVTVAGRQPAATPSSTTRPPVRSRAATPVPLVDNFLTAMTATPLNTYVARQFLTADSSRSWVPERGTVVYGSQQLVSGPADRSCCGCATSSSSTAGAPGAATRPAARGRDYRLQLVKEGGEWRISHPPDRLIIPRTHFDAAVPAVPPLLLRQVRARRWCPSRSTCPRGRQAPTLLVAGLLKGPRAGAAAASSGTFLPAGHPRWTASRCRSPATAPPRCR